MEASWSQSQALALTLSPFGSYPWQDKQAEGCQHLELDPPSWRRGLGGTDPAVGTQNGCGADSVHSLGVSVSWSEMQASPSIGEPKYRKSGQFRRTACNLESPAHQAAGLNWNPDLEDKETREAIRLRTLNRDQGGSWPSVMWRSPVNQPGPPGSQPALVAFQKMAPKELKWPVW